MTTINGIPAHALLIHAIVVLAPLVALLEILWVLASGPSTLGVAGFGARSGHPGAHTVGRQLRGVALRQTG